MKCNVARDLLPLYFEGLCSEETKRELEEHMEHCGACGELKRSLETEQEWPDKNREWNRPIEPFRKIHRKLRRKNILIAACVLFLLLSAACTAALAYGQIARKGVSFEWICEAIRFRHIGKQFAGGDIETLYQVLYNGYQSWDAESGVIRLAYGDRESYDEDMKEAILEKYHRYFDGKELTYQGIEDIGYRETPGVGWSRTLSICLKFQGKDNLEYYMNFYRALDGQYLVDDFFGNPYMAYTAGGETAAPETEKAEPYHTEDSLFSCLPNGLRDIDWHMGRFMVMLGGQRGLQGDTALTENGQLRLGILSEQDLEEGTNSLNGKIDDGLARLTRQGYYLTDITWSPIEYDRTEHLYRYRLNMELTGEAESDRIAVTLEGYRISDQLVYIPGTQEVHGDGITPEISHILETLCE